MMHIAASEGELRKLCLYGDDTVRLQERARLAAGSPLSPAHKTTTRQPSSQTHDDHQSRRRRTAVAAGKARGEHAVGRVDRALPNQTHRSASLNKRPPQVA